MRMNQFTTPLALLAAFTLFSAPASAQERGQGRRERSGQEASGQAQRAAGAARTVAPSAGHSAESRIESTGAARGIAAVD